MAFVDWIIDKIIQIIIAILGGVVIYYLIQIKNQKASISNSPNSQNAQLQTGNITNSQINILKEGIKKEIAFSEEIPEKEDNPRKLFSKIENYLDKNKPLSTIAEMSLRLAQELRMNDDEKWLKKEVYGYKEYLEIDEKEAVMKIKKREKENQHRRIEAELNLGFKNGQIESFKIPMFISQSLSQIETWKDLYLKEKQIVLMAQPINIMVETLNVNPNEKVPYLVYPSSFKKILDETRLKIIDFLNRTKEKIK